jgi:serine/threonine-protein kinase
MKLDVGEIVADKYRIDRHIGEGGMGTVYSATNQMTGRTVALKWLRADLCANPHFTERFMREARIAGRLDHPNIVNVYDVGRHGDSLFLVMELLRGESFDEWLRRGPQPPTDCVALLMPAFRAIQAAHVAGIVHRDLKPDNLFLCKDGDLIRQTKVLDFGIAKDIGDTPSHSLTSPGSLVGTVHYMAPEQVRSSRYVDARTDVYALGVILYSCLGGGLPFESESIGELIIEIAGGLPEPLGKRAPHLPERLVEIVMRSMARDPDARYQSVAEFARALEPFAGGVRFRASTVRFLTTGSIVFFGGGAFFAKWVLTWS